MLEEIIRKIKSYSTPIILVGAMTFGGACSDEQQPNNIVQEPL